MRALALSAALLVALAAGPARAEPPAEAGTDWVAVAIDIPIVRALSVAATAVGCGLFVVTLPVTAPFQVVGDAADQLVLEPGRYAFTRPVGKL